jgi:hypothetical protein
MTTGATIQKHLNISRVVVTTSLLSILIGSFFGKNPTETSRYPIRLGIGILPRPHHLVDLEKPDT